MINSMPKLKLLDFRRIWLIKNELLSCLIQYYFSEKSESINVLEAGCGRKWFFDMGKVKFNLTGVDINKKAIEIRKSISGDLDRFVVGDLRNVNFVKESFDLVTCINVLEHIEGAKVVIDNIFSWLKPNGLAILEFPDRDTTFGFVTRNLPHCFHILYYKFIVGDPNVGKPGFGPFPTVYDQIISRNSFLEYCRKYNYKIILEYGIQIGNRKFGRYSSKVRLLFIIFFNIIKFLSFGRLSSSHIGLLYVLQKK